VADANLKTARTLGLCLSFSLPLDHGCTEDLKFPCSQLSVIFCGQHVCRSGLVLYCPLGVSIVVLEKHTALADFSSTARRSARFGLILLSSSPPASGLYCCHFVIVLIDRVPTISTSI
jgi:hypothetical protein